MANSRLEEFLAALLNGGEVPAPQSRVEAYLYALLNGGEVPAPRSRVEAYLYALCQQGLPGDGTGGDSGGSGGSDFEVTEGTITPITASQTLRIPWGKETLPLFYLCIRQDFDTYVTPDNPSTTIELGGVVCLCSGYTRESASLTKKYINIKLTTTKDYAGYIAAHSPFPADAEILDSNGLLAYSNGSSYKWSTDATYKYYIVDKAVA